MWAGSDSVCIDRLNLHTYPDVAQTRGALGVFDNKGKLLKCTCRLEERAHGMQGAHEMIGPRAFSL